MLSSHLLVSWLRKVSHSRCKIQLKEFYSALPRLLVIYLWQRSCQGKHTVGWYELLAMRTDKFSLGPNELSSAGLFSISATPVNWSCDVWGNAAGSERNTSSLRLILGCKWVVRVQVQVIFCYQISPTSFSYFSFRSAREKLIWVTEGARRRFSMPLARFCDMCL